MPDLRELIPGVRSHLYQRVESARYEIPGRSASRHTRLHAIAQFTRGEFTCGEGERPAFSNDPCVRENPETHMRAARQSAFVKLPLMI